jgi:hypothetical protein
MTYQNKYKCGTRIWRKLRWPGRATYNEVYGLMTRDPRLMQPTTKSFRAALISKEDWHIIAHNAACVAAWAADKAADRLAA